MSEIPQSRNSAQPRLASLACWCFLVLAALPAWGESPPGPAGAGAPEKRLSLILSGEFFQAMEKLASSGTVTGDRQEQLLEQIALAQKYLVKTNLALLDQQEKIVRLLEELNRQRQGGGR